MINTAFSYGFYASGLLLGFSYQIASFISIVLGIIFSFLMNGSIVFKGVSKASLVRYILVWAFLYLLNIYLIGWAQKFSLNLYGAGAITSIPIGFIGYLLMNFFVFPLKKSY